jgi:hypothetical protein
MRNSLKAAVAATAVASFIVLGVADQSAAIDPGAVTKGGAAAKANPAAATTSKAEPAAAATGKAMLGMSAPAALWDQRVKEVGPGLQARRIFLTSFDAGLSLPTKACNDGMYPVISIKPGSYSWTQVAGGQADSAIKSMATKLAALPCDVFVTVSHEPYGDGAPADWAKMEAHALPLLGSDPGVKVGVIANGWFWSSTKKGLSDAEIAEYIPRSVIDVSDVIGADTYQTNPIGETAGDKMRNLAAWARRVGGVKGLGVGEFNAPTAGGVTDATSALGSDPMFEWGCLWNTTQTIATVLTGDRLTAFKQALANW